MMPMQQQQFRPPMAPGRPPAASRLTATTAHDNHHVHTWLGRPVPARAWFVPVIAAATLAVIAGVALVVGRYAGHPWYVPTAAGIGGALLVACAMWRTAGESYHDTIRLHVILFTLLGALWLAMASFPAAWRGGLRPVTIGILLVGAVAASVTWVPVRHRQIAHEADRCTWHCKRITATPLAIERGPAMVPQKPRNKWEQLFDGLQRPGMTFVSRTAGRGGPIVRMRLPVDGRYTVDTIRQLTPNIEIALSWKGTKVPPGSVTVEPCQEDGVVSSTDFLMHINTVNILSQTLWEPEADDGKPVSIEEAFCVGHFQDGEPFYMTVREIHWLIIAVSGNGKSNLLHVVIKRVSRCYDAVIWMIDMKGGATAKPWILPWIEGRINPATGKRIRRPVLDWVAIDRHEAERIYRAFIALANDRPFRRNGSRTVPSRKRPHVLLLTDEQSRVTGTHTGPRAGAGAEAGLTSAEFANLGVDASAIARSEALSLMSASQRNTVTTTGRGDALANYKGRACLGAADQQDARMVLPKSANAARLAAALDQQGTMLASAPGNTREMPIKVFFMGDDDELDRRVGDAAATNGEWAPGIHECGPKCEADCEWASDLDAVREFGYTDRWADPDRFGWVYGKHKGSWVGKPLRVKVIDGKTVAEPKPGGAAARPGSATSQLAEYHRLREIKRAQAAGLSAPRPPAPAPAQPTSFFQPPPRRPVSGVPVSGPATPGQPGQLADMADQAGEDWVDAFIAEVRDEPTGAPGVVEVTPAEMSNVDIVVEIIDSYGVKGCSWTTLKRVLTERGVITDKNYSQMSRWVRRAKADGRIDQPGRERTPYFTPRHLQPKVA